MIFNIFIQLKGPSLCCALSNTIYLVPQFRTDNNIIGKLKQTQIHGNANKIKKTLCCNVIYFCDAVSSLDSPDRENISHGCIKTIDVGDTEAFEGTLEVLAAVHNG